MDLAKLAQAVLAIGTILATLVGIEGRQRRLRSHIRENLTLVGEIEANDALRELTGASSWLQGRIAVDIAKLAGHNLGTRKKAIPYGSVAFAAILAAAFGAWSYLVLKDGFEWLGTFPAIVSGLMLVSIFGMVTNRQLPPDEGLPEGAVEMRSETASEQVAGAIALAAAGGLDDRWRDDGQIGIVMRFIEAARSGDFEAALRVADDNFKLCRVQAWLWNNREEYEDIEDLAVSMLERSEPTEVWDEFIAIESGSYAEAFEPIDMKRFGAASKRRRIGRDHDLVILAPVGNESGYWVSRATILPAAVTFVVSRSGSGWLVAAPFATAPPLPGWPPTWWSSDDPATDALSE